METERQYCTFRVADLFFGVEVTQVQEVLKIRDLAPVPLAQDPIEGLLNLRGQIVTAIDLRRRLGLPARETDVPPMLLVMRDEDSVIAFLADSVGDVIEVAADTFESAPATLSTEARELVSGVFKLPKELLHLLDIEKAAGIGCA